MLKLDDPCLFSFLRRFAGPENFDLFRGTNGTGGGALPVLDDFVDVCERGILQVNLQMLVLYYATFG